MILELRRKQFKEYTIGELYIDGHYFCDTLEDRVRKLEEIKDKVYSKTAIPKGEYKVVISFSPRFKRLMPLLLNVPFFTGIRIHAGNTTEDTSGCILVGRKTESGRLVNSSLTFRRLMSLLSKSQKTQPIVIHIYDN